MKGHEMGKKTLSIIIKVYTERQFYKDELGASIPSIGEFISQYGDAECILVCRDEAEMEKLKELNVPEPSFRCFTEAALDKSVAAADDSDPAGEYILFLDQGDTVNAKKLTKVLAYVKKNDHGIYALRLPKKSEGAIKAVRNGNHWASIFTAPYDEMYDPHGMIIRTRLAQSPAYSLSSFLTGDAYATEAVIMAVMDNEGFARIETTGVIKTNDPESIDYTVVPEVFDRLIEYSKDRFGCIEDYLQSTMLTLLFFQSGEGSTQAIEQYIGYIDTDIITGDEDIKQSLRMWYLNLKYGTNVLGESEITDDGDIIYDGRRITNLKKLRFRIDKTEVSGGILTFNGRTDFNMLKKGLRMYMALSDGEAVPVEMTDFPSIDILGPEKQTVWPRQRFTVSVPLRDGCSCRFYMEEENGRRFWIIPGFYVYSRFVFGPPKRTLTTGGYTIIYQNGTFDIHKSRFGLRFREEIDYMKYLWSKGKKNVVGYRLLYYIDRFFSRKPVWIVADRPHIANDNGEHMFRYLQTTEAAKKNNIYFLIREDSPDYERLRKTGKVLKYGSRKHKIKFLESQVIMCAAANELAINAMGQSSKYYRDLYDYHFIYLRHGVSHNDQSRWINKLAKNISLLVATCRPEYDGIINGPYGYTEKEVHLTGLPRYDNLYDEREKEIIILPTWRKSLEGEMEYRSSEREYTHGFADSDYCRFYNGLINDERLLSVMEEYGYKGSFYLHPVFEKQYKDFKSSRLIKVGKGVADYQELFRKGAIMVTDYSSVAFDFAYLKKPVIYSQFDEESFYKNHSWGKGYFTYRRDAFGPITTTLDETVEELIAYIKNDCRMKDEYKEKVDNFFAYTDRNNCKRVYEATMELERERSR